MEFNVKQTEAQFLSLSYQLRLQAQVKVYITCQLYINTISHTLLHLLTQIFWNSLKSSLNVPNLQILAKTWLRFSQNFLRIFIQTIFQKFSKTFHLKKFPRFSKNYVISQDFSKCASIGRLCVFVFITYNLDIGSERTFPWW